LLLVFRNHKKSRSDFEVIMVMWYARLSRCHPILLRISYSKCFISGQCPARSDFFVAALRDYVRKAEQEEGRLVTDTVETHFAYDIYRYMYIGASATRVEGKYDCTNCARDRERLCHRNNWERDSADWFLKPQMKSVKQFFVLKLFKLNETRRSLTHTTHVKNNLLHTHTHRLPPKMFVYKTLHPAGFMHISRNLCTHTRGPHAYINDLKIVEKPTRRGVMWRTIASIFLPLMNLLYNSHK